LETPTRQRHAYKENIGGIVTAKIIPIFEYAANKLYTTNDKVWMVHLMRVLNKTKRDKPAKVIVMRRLER
jgi:hypothetical protein